MPEASPLVSTPPPFDLMPAEKQNTLDWRMNAECFSLAKASVLQSGDGPLDAATTCMCLESGLHRRQRNP